MTASAHAVHTARRLLAAALLAAALLALSTTALASHSRRGATPALPSLAAPISSAASSDTVVVSFRPGTDLTRFRGRHSEVSSVGSQAPHGTTRRIHVKAGESLADALSRLGADPSVAYAEPLVRYQTFDVTPNDTLYATQWGLPAIHAPKVWVSETGNTTPVTIAIVDSGIDSSNPDFSGKIAPGGYNWVAGNTNTTDDNGHGTHVAGIAAARGNDNYGVAGVSWGAKLLPLKVMDSAGSGYSDNIAAGIRYAADQGCRVINLSLGSTASSQVLADACAYARARGVLVIAAAGNFGENGDPVCYPAAYDGVVAVASVDSGTSRSRFSEYGSYVDIAAPGESILSDIISSRETSGFGTLSGTSMATPFVSGAAALLYSARPGLTPAQAESLLEDGADDIGLKGRDDLYGSGMLDVAASLDLATRPILVSSTNPASESGWTNTTAIDVALRYPGATQYRLSEDASFTSSPWFSVLATAPFTISSGDGTKTVYAQFRSSATPVTSTYQEGDSHIQLSGTWTTTSNTKYSGGAARQTSASGASATFSFRGTAVSWLSGTSSRGGIARVTLDGIPQGTVDTYGSITYGTLWSASDLAPGDHTLIIADTGDKNPLSAGTQVTLDALTATDDGTTPAYSDSLVLDTVAPDAPTITSPSEGATVSAGDVCVAGHGEAGCRLNAACDTQEYASAVAADGSFSLSVQVWPGNAAVDSAQEDQAGNLSAHSARSLCAVPNSQGGVWSDVGLWGLSVSHVSASPVLDGCAYGLSWGNSNGPFVMRTPGSPWVLSNSDLPNTGWTSVACNPRNPEQALVGGPGGVFQTTDSGASWSRETTVPTNGVLWSAAGHLYEYNYIDHHLHVEVNGAWSDSGPTPTAAAVLVGNDVPGELYLLGASNSDQYLYHSFDDGLTWSPLYHFGRVGCSSLAVDPANHRELAIASGQGLYVSDDSGLTWRVARAGWINDAEYIGTGGSLFVSNGSVIYSSSDATSWGDWNASAALPGFVAGTDWISGICAGRNALYVSSSIVGVCSSRDFGRSWGVQRSFLPMMPELSVTGSNDASVDLAATSSNGQSTGQLMFHSRASGQWSPSPSSPASHLSGDLAFDALDPHSMLLTWSSSSGANGVSVTHNDGGSWDTTSSLHAASPDGSVVAYASCGSPASFDMGAQSIMTLFVDGTTTSTMLVSRDTGRSWALAGEFLRGAYRAMAVGPDHRIFVAVDDITGNQVHGVVVYRSSDGGVTWDSVRPPRSGAGGFPYQGFSCLQVDPNSSSTLFASTEDMLFESQDSGATWTQLPVIGHGPSVTPTWSHTGRLVVSSISGKTVVYFGIAEGLLSSTDGGQTWRLSSVEQTVGDQKQSRISSLLSDGKRLFVAIEGAGAYQASASSECTAAADCSLANASRGQVRVDAGSANDIRVIMLDGTESSLIGRQRGVSALALSDGVHTLSALSRDLFGNAGPASQVVVTIDTTPPSTTATVSPAPGRYGVTAGPATISLSTTDAVVGVASVHYGIDTSSTLTTYTAPFAAPSGNHTIWVSSTDATGNVEAPHAYAFTVDSTPPALSLTSPLSGANLTLPTLVSGTAIDSNLLSWRLDLGQGSAPATYTTLSSAEGTSLAQPTCLLDPGTYAPGAYTLRLRATDLAGNTSSLTCPVTLGAWPTARWGSHTLSNSHVAISFDASGVLTDWRADLNGSGSPFDDVELLRGQTAADSGVGLVLDSDATRAQGLKVDPASVSFAPHATATEAGQRISFTLPSERLSVVETWTLSPQATVPVVDVSVTAASGATARRVSLDCRMRSGTMSTTDPDDLALLDSATGQTLSSLSLASDTAASTGAWGAMFSSSIPAAVGIASDGSAPVSIASTISVWPFSHVVSAAVASSTVALSPGTTLSAHLGLVSGTSAADVAEAALPFTASFIPPAITALSASSGAPGTSVTITGSHFGVTQGAGIVTFAGAVANVTSWSDSSITVTVPTGAQSGYVGVRRGGVFSNGAYFLTSAPPALTALSTDASPVGSSLTLTGTGFGTTTGTVTFAGAPASITAWSDTSVTALVPAGAVPGYVGVWKSGACSNGIWFAPAARPRLADVDPMFAAPGTLLTITGTDFGVTKGAVTLAGESCAVVTWSPATVTVMLPLDATSGYLGVWQGGICSNGVWFGVIR